MEKPFLSTKVQTFIDTLVQAGGRPLYEQSYQEARNVLRKIQSDNKKTSSNLKVDSADIEIAPERKMPIKIIRPQNPVGKMPIIFYIHGGGWVMGDYDTHQNLVLKLSEETGAAVIFPIYTPSPEAQFPQTTDDLFASLQYIVQHAAQYGFDTNNLVVAGDSVGGNMAIALSLLAKQNGFAPKIKFMLLFYPVTDAGFETKSYNEFADGPWLTKKAMQWFWDAYAPKKKDRNNILASPLLAETKDLQGLPTTLIITGENDVLRDEGEDFARKLDDAGVQVTEVRFGGTIHDFVMLNALQDTEQSRIAIALASGVLRDIFLQQS